MKNIALGALFLLLLPVAAEAAGFAKQSLFLSKSSVTEGDTVYIHAVVSNEDSAAFKGDMVFSEKGAPIGTAAVSLGVGEADAVSVSWKPSAGSHTVVAELKRQGEVLEKQSSTFSVAAKPLPPPPSSGGSGGSSQSAAAVESSQKIQEGIASFSPTAAEASAPVFVLIDGGRESLSNIIDSQITTAKQTLGPKEGSVLSAETVRNAPKDPVSTFWLILWTLYLYVLTILNFLIGNAGVFYPLFALIVLYILWRMVQRFRRPAY
jgi:hypothetical protein